jgi:ketosteroid isomerase-like protein
MTLLQTISAAGIVLLLSSLPAAAFDAQTEGQLLLARDAEWATTASEGRDVEKAASYWADDAVIIPQGQPVIEGKPAIRAFVTNVFHTPGFHIHWVSEKPVFSPDGNLAYLRSTTMTTVPSADGKPINILSRGITVWRRDIDGQWRCIVDIWNDAPKASAPAK